MSAASARVVYSLSLKGIHIMKFIKRKLCGGGFTVLFTLYAKETFLKSYTPNQLVFCFEQRRDATQTIIVEWFF